MISNPLHDLFEKAKKDHKAIKLHIISGQTIIIEPEDVYSFSSGGQEISINEETIIALSYVVLVKLIPNKEEREAELLEAMREMEIIP